MDELELDDQIILGHNSYTAMHFLEDKCFDKISVLPLVNGDLVAIQAEAASRRDCSNRGGYRQAKKEVRYS